MKQPLFFDSLSTTPCLEQLRQTLCEYQIHQFGNPSSDHTLGRASRNELENARSVFSSLFHVPTEQVIFTSSGTEANNLAIQGTILAQLAQGVPGQDLHVITARSEHPSVLRTAEALRDWGVRVDVVSVSPSGEASFEEVLEYLTPKTTLVSLMHVNNIIGVLQPVEAWAKRIREKAPQVVIHVDGIQAFGKTTHPTASSEIDLYTLSGHKIQGPKGAGALIRLHPTPLRPILFGGGQEAGLRSGTQATANLIAFAKAAQSALQNQEKHQQALKRLRNQLQEELAPLIETGLVTWNSPSSSLPHIIHLSTPGAPSLLVTRFLDEAGYCVSRGSACSSGRPGPDALLIAMGKSLETCRSPLRIGLSHQMSRDDIREFVQALIHSLKKIDHYRIHTAS